MTTRRSRAEGPDDGEPEDPGDDHDEAEAESEAEAAFGRGVTARGEAARAAGGELPPGVTHEIVGDDDDDDDPAKSAEDGEVVPRIRRRRFSAF